MIAKIWSRIWREIVDVCPEEEVETSARCGRWLWSYRPHNIRDILELGVNCLLAIAVILTAIAFFILLLVPILFVYIITPDDE